jgi:hypothetical protein
MILGIGLPRGSSLAQECCATLGSVLALSGGSCGRRKRRIFAYSDQAQRAAATITEKLSARFLQHAPPAQANEVDVRLTRSTEQHGLQCAAGRLSTPREECGHKSGDTFGVFPPAAQRSN